MYVARAEFENPHRPPRRDVRGTHTVGAGRRSTTWRCATQRTAGAARHAVAVCVAQRRPCDAPHRGGGSHAGVSRGRCPPRRGASSRRGRSTRWAAGRGDGDGRGAGRRLGAHPDEALPLGPRPGVDGVAEERRRARLGAVTVQPTEVHRGAGHEFLLLGSVGDLDEDGGRGGGGESGEPASEGRQGGLVAAEEVPVAGVGDERGAGAVEPERSGRVLHPRAGEARPVAHEVDLDHAVGHRAQRVFAIGPRPAGRRGEEAARTDLRALRLDPGHRGEEDLGVVGGAVGREGGDVAREAHAAHARGDVGEACDLDAHGLDVVVDLLGDHRGVADDHDRPR